MAASEQVAPLCTVCNHRHFPQTKCSICGHVGGQRVRRGPSPIAFHFKTLRFPGKTTGRKWKIYDRNYTIVKMLRYKTRKGIDFSNFYKRQENAGDGTYTANYDCSPEQEQGDRNGIHLIGLVGDAPIAVLSIFPCDQRYILLRYVGVLISYQNKGYGKKIVNEAVDIVKRMSDSTVKGLVLDCPAKRNTFEFFKRLDFHPFAEGAQRFNSHGEQVCRMVRNF